MRTGTAFLWPVCAIAYLNQRKNGHFVRNSILDARRKTFKSSASRGASDKYRPVSGNARLDDRKVEKPANFVHFKHSLRRRRRRFTPNF